MTDPLFEFTRLGKLASYHFAAEATWEVEAPQGYAARDKALAIFDAHPELHDQMREAAKSFLWTLERP